MSQNVGEIDLGLSINQEQFNRQLNNIASGAQRSVTSAFGGVGKMIGKVLGVAAVVGFGKSCLDLGSDLSEVQNVVDVTFGTMAEEVNKFASAAITQFGLSETAAKQYTGTMGAMLKSSGLTTKQALEMSKTITGLSADMASFYNLSSEDAFEKIRSGISGETEPLKQLGINMSVANMEAYAMAQGISKAYSKMTQQEQTLLRYNYLLSVTKDAQGDFARTSDSWANQVRILSEQFNALKAAIGQGLIAAFTPIVKGLNVVIAKLRVAAGYFKAFMELIFGKQSDSGGSGLSEVADSTDSIADSAGGASDAVEGVGDAAQKAGKKAKGALASFDELNQLNLSSGGSGDSEGGSSGLEDMGGAVEVDFGEVEEGATKLDGLFDGLIDEVNRLKDLFATGFKWGLGDDFDKKIADIKSSIEGIKASLKDIFTDSEVVNSSKNFLDSIVLNAGKVTGSMVSIGTTIAQNLLGGVNKYLEQNKQYIKERLVGIMDASSEVADLVGNFAIAFADIFSVFGGETAQQVTANIIAIFGNGFLGALELGIKFGRDITKCITEPIIENKEGFKTALEGLLVVFESFSGTMAELVTNSYSKVLEVYDTYFAPGFEKIKNGISELVGCILDNFNTYILPILQEWGQEFQQFYSTYLQPLIDKLLEVGGKIFNLLADLWKNILSPIAQWLISTLAPAVSSALDIVWNAILKVSEFLATTFKDVLSILEGVIDFLDGVFTGDWNKAWEGIKEIVSGIGDFLYDVTIGGLLKIVEWLTESFITSWQGVVESIENLFAPIGEWFSTNVIEPVKQFFTDLWENIKQVASECWNGLVTAWQGASTWFNTTVVEPIKKFFSDLWEVIKTKASEAWNGIVSVWNAAGTWFSTTIIEPIKTKFSEWSTNVKQLASDAWNGLKNTWNSAKQWFSSTVIDPITTSFSKLWTGLKTSASNAFTEVGNSAKRGMNWVIDHINNMIDGINSKLSFTLPEFFGGGKVGFSIPNIPKLARGGVVEQPTLAMIGEAGKEAVVPLQNNTEWTGQVAGLLANALLPLMQGVSGDGDSNRDIVVNLDSVELVRAFLPTLVKEANRQGVTIG